MKIALVISSLSGGGAERVMATLANAWARDGAEVTLITLATRSADVYALEPAIHRVELNVVRRSSNVFEAIANNATRIRCLRAAIASCQPDVVISFMTTTNMLAVLACWGLRIPVVVAERTFFSARLPTGVWRFMHRSLYRRAACVVSQTKRGAEDLKVSLGRAVHTIPNPVVIRVAVDDLSSAMPVPHDDSVGVVLAVGRLVREKGFDLLIEAFSKIAPSHAKWNLVILGEGPLRSELMAQIAALGLDDRVTLPGFSNDPHGAMRQADIFVLSSRYEGMPNALLEAMATGLPCVSFDCRTGPAELIDHGVNGWLVPAEDVPAFGMALAKLMDDADLRVHLGASARGVQSVFGVKAVLEQWNELLVSVIHGRCRSDPPSRAT